MTTQTTKTPIVLALETLFDGPQTRYEACGVTVTHVFADYPDSVNRAVFAYGLGRFAQDKANRWANETAKATGTAPTDAQRKATVESIVAKMKDGDLGSAPRDEVAVESIKLATLHVLAALGGLTQKEAAATETGARYFTTSSKGAILPNYDALRAFITANPDLNIPARAKAIVDSRATDPGEVQIKL